ncbi:uncharacterized protein kel [Nematolebias whitei]|uniref:uncharacterized protein kel n=1 Tax=Nematolebias whitei TaxID=451745 RepID=UPI00189B0865|nr:uncharacterized protein kel [Nematolebias whitei]
MSQSSTQPEPELSLQSLSQSEPESGPPQPPHPSQPPAPPTQDPHQLQSQSQDQPALQQEQASNLEHQEKPLWIKHQRVLLLVLGLTVCAAISGLLYYIHHSLHRNTITVSPCLSLACRLAEARLSTSPDPFTQPCDHFLSTCGAARSQKSGGRQRGQGILGHPQNRMERSVWPEVRNEQTINRSPVEEKTLSRKTVLLQNLREILETNYKSNSSAFQKTQHFYHSCMDMRAIETTGAEPFLKLIQKLGGWAVSGQWNKTDFNTTLGLLMRDYGTFPFFNLYVGKDPEEAASRRTKRYIQIDQPELLIPIAWDNKTQKSKAEPQALRPFLASCQSYLALLGAPQSEHMKHVGMFLSLSSELAVAASPLYHRQSKGLLHQRVTIKELQVSLLLNEINACFIAVSSHNKIVHAVGDCVWAHYLNATDKTGRRGVLPLSAAQQQEVWVQYSALQVALQAYYRSLNQDPADTSLLGTYHVHLFLRAFSQINCDADPYSESMPLDPSFFILVICANSNFCPSSLQCSIKRQQNSSQTDSFGKGLGKAGAKRLGRMLKRAIQHQEGPSRKKKDSVPNTPIRLLKHQIEAKAKNAPRTNSSKLTSQQVAKLILSLVSQCKHRAGISMAEVKQILAAQGYDVTKNNRQVNMVTKRMVNNRTLVETKRNASFRLNKADIGLNSKPLMFYTIDNGKKADKEEHCDK